jgi:hypothetical protein
LAGKKSEELEELIDESKIDSEESKNLPFIEKLKIWLYKTLRNHAFIVVTLCASVIYLVYNIYYLDTKSII